MMYSFLPGLTAVIAAFSLMFSSPAEPATNQDLYSRIQTMHTSADFTVSLSGESNIDPYSLEVLDNMLVAQHEEETNYPSSPQPISIKTLVSDLFSATYNASGSYNFENAGKSGSIYTDSNANFKLSVNPALKFTTDVKNSLWLDYDFTSLDNFKCEIISLSPDDVRYVVYDLALMLTEEEKQELLDTLDSNLLTGEKQLPEFDTNEILSVMKNNSTLTVDTPTHAQIVMSNENVKNYISYIIDMAFSSVASELESESTGIQPIEETIELDFTNPAKEFISSLNLFNDNEAIVSDYYFDAEGNLIKSTQTINFSFNLRDVWAKVDEFSNMPYDDYTTDDEFESGFEIETTSENLWFQLPEGKDDFIFSLKSETKYSNIGKNSAIEKPELTELNSRNMYEEQLISEINKDPNYGYDDWYDPYNYVSEYGNAYWRNEITVPLRGFVESACYGNEEIIFDNGKITINSNGDTKLFETIEAELGSCTVIKDGVSYTLSAPLYTLDGQTRITEDFFKTLWNGEIEDINVYVHNRDETGYYYMTDYRIYIPKSEDELL